MLSRSTSFAARSESRLRDPALFPAGNGRELADCCARIDRRDGITFPTDPAAQIRSGEWVVRAGQKRHGEGLPGPPAVEPRVIAIVFDARLSAGFTSWITGGFHG
jgi:hypothetical protein